MNVQLNSNEAAHLSAQISFKHTDSDSLEPTTERIVKKPQVPSNNAVVAFTNCNMRLRFMEKQT